ncbi:MAG: SPOR domain-containing protein [Bacteroidota bacterium]
MADALVTHLARALHLPPDAAQQTLHHLVATLRDQIEATGEAAVPGLGVFRRSGARLAFEPEDALVRAVNHRYAGLAPVAAETAAPRPASETAAAGFQPLPTFIAPEEPADSAAPDFADEAAEAPAPPEAEPETPEPPIAGLLADEPPPEEPPVLATASTPIAPDDSELEPAEPEAASEPPMPAPNAPSDTTITGETDDAPSDIEEPEPEEVPRAPEEDGLDEVIAFEGLSDLETGEEAEDDTFEDEDTSLDELLAHTWTDGGDADDDAHPLGPMPEEPLEDAEYAVIEPDEGEPDEPGAEATVVAPAVLASDAASSEAVPADDEPVAPAVAAVSAAGPEPPQDRKPEERSGRGPLFAGLAVGVLLAIAFLLWTRSREPAPAPVAERPPVADTAAAVPPPADSAVATLPTDPVEEEDPDPLRSAGTVAPADGGFTWVIGSELSQAAAEQRVEAYRTQGFRSGVVAQEAAGQTRYRVSLGQFDTVAEAEARRGDLPADAPSDSWILRL